MHQRHTPYGKRAIVEIRLPARRPGQPDRFVSVGAMPTPRQNDAVVSLPSVIVEDCGPLLGDYVIRPQRMRRPDKAKGRYIDRLGEVVDGLPPDKVDAKLGPNQRVLREPDDYQVRLARNEVLDALYHGTLLRGRWHVVQRNGQLRTVPTRGKVVRWGSLEDLVQALAQGVPF